MALTGTLALFSVIEERLFAVAIAVVVAGASGKVALFHPQEA